MNTTSEVEPAEINGRGIPVGGMLPLNTSYCIIKLLFYKNVINSKFIV